MPFFGTIDIYNKSQKYEIKTIFKTAKYTFERTEEQEIHFKEKINFSANKYHYILSNNEDALNLELTPSNVFNEVNMISCIFMIFICYSVYGRIFN